MLAQMKIQESKGFEIIGSNSNENSKEELLKNVEYTGYFLPSDPDERDYFMRCPTCRGLIPDSGLREKIQCDICKKIIHIPENNFQEVKQASLYDEPHHKTKTWCKNMQNICKIITNFFPFWSSSPLYKLPSFKNVVFYINKEKLNNSEHKDKDFIEIINNIILPFFQYKSRIVNIDKIFEIDGIEFKVISAYPHYLTAKVTSKTSIVCNDYYSFTSPIINVTFLTIRKRELESNDYISNQIMNTPFPVQKSIIEGFNCRINTYDLVVRNCSPKYGIITNETSIRVINRNIENLKSITIVSLHNEENIELNDKKNNKAILNNFIRPFFYNGNKKYIERGDVLKIGKLEIFILKAKPSTGFVVEDFTKITMKYDYTLEQCQNELNEQIEIESLQRRQERYFSNENNVTNNINTSINTSINNNSNNNNNNNDNITNTLDLNNELFNDFQERMRFLSSLLSHRRRLIRFNSRLNNININLNEDNNFYNFNFNVVNGDEESNNNIENNNIQINNEILNNLPVFKIDEKFMEVSQKKENKNEFQNCVICMEKYEINNEVKTLPCFHLFHKDCIDQWLKAGNDSCPICKNKINHNDDLNEEYIDE